MVVQVDGARTDEDARVVGRAVAGSMLVKTALFGRDANPGRILQAVGASGVPLDPALVAASLGGVPVIEEGRIPSRFDPRACAEAMKEREVLLRIRMGGGPARPPRSAATWDTSTSASTASTRRERAGRLHIPLGASVGLGTHAREGPHARRGPLVRAGARRLDRGRQDRRRRDADAGPARRGREGHRAAAPRRHPPRGRPRRRPAGHGDGRAPRDRADLRRRPPGNRRGHARGRPHGPGRSGEQGSRHRARSGRNAGPGAVGSGRRAAAGPTPLPRPRTGRRGRARRRRRAAASDGTVRPGHRLDRGRRRRPRATT